jgi:hypothetical protein
MTRAVSCGCYNAKADVPGKPVLDVESEAHRAYLSVVGKERYDGFDWSTSLISDWGLMEEIETRSTIHSSHHDVESVYWVLIVFLIRALPADSKITDSTLGKFTECYKPLIDHEIGTIMDSRLHFTSSLARPGSKILHPGLSALDQFLRIISRYINPEYAYLTTPPKEDFLHEAVSRIIADQIFKLKDDPILLNTKARRKPQEVYERIRDSV